VIAMEAMQKEKIDVAPVQYFTRKI